VNVALVQYAQQNINHQQCRDNQYRLVALRVLEHCRLATVTGNDGCWQADGFPGLVNACRRISQGCAGREIERHRNGLQLPNVVDGCWPHRPLYLGEGCQRNQCAGGRTDINIVDRTFIHLGLRCHFQNHLVAVGRQINCRNLPLTKGAEQRRSDCINRYAQCISPVPINIKLGLQTTQLCIAGYIPKHGVRSQFFLQFSSPVVQLVGTNTLQDVLKLGFAGPSAQLQVLNGSHENADAGDFAQFAPQTFDNLLHRQTLVTRLKSNKHAPGVLRTTSPVERTNGKDIRI